MDPLTILALAKGSYEAIKAGIKLGKEVQGMFKDISSLMDSVGKLTQIAAQPPRPKLFSGESAEQIAMNAYMAKAEAEKMYHEVKNVFIAERGLAAWEWVMKETVRIKKEQKAAAIQARKEQEEMMEQIKFFGIISFFVIAIFVVAVAALLAAVK